MTPFRQRRVLKVEIVEGGQLVGLLSDYTRAAERPCVACGLRTVGGECGCVTERAS